MNPSVLYICYFGLREPLVQTQVLPYLRGLASAGHEMHLLTFERHAANKWPNDQALLWRSRLREVGIEWTSLRYHRRPSLPATAYDSAQGARLATKLVKQHNIELLHARSHVGAAIGAEVKRRSGAKLLFDIRGFLPEEYVDAGTWRPNGFLFRLAKRMERRLIEQADGFVVLTARAQEELKRQYGLPFDSKPLRVIPCCVDTARFAVDLGVHRERIRNQLVAEDRTVLVYVGALGGWYLTDELADFLATAHFSDPSYFALILTQSPHDMIASRLRRRGLPESEFRIQTVDTSEIPGYLAAADIGVSFIKPCHSKLASSPTKLGEYFSAGLPVVANAGVGDCDRLLNSAGLPDPVKAFASEEYLRVLTEMKPLLGKAETRGRLRQIAVRELSLEEVGIPRYRDLYRCMLPDRPSAFTPPALEPLAAH